MDFVWTNDIENIIDDYPEDISHLETATGIGIFLWCFLALIKEFLM